MPKDETETISAGSAEARGAIGRLISAGIANLGMQKQEFFGEFAPTDSDKAYASYVAAWNKVLTGERKIDRERAEVLSKWIPCGSEYITPKDWQLLEFEPEMVPKRFLANHSFDFSSETDQRPDVGKNPLDKKNSTQAIEIDKKFSPNQIEEARISQEQGQESKLSEDFDGSADPFGLDDVMVKEIRLPNGYSVVLTKEVPLSAVSSAIERMTSVPERNVGPAAE